LFIFINPSVLSEQGAKATFHCTDTNHKDKDDDFDQFISSLLELMIYFFTRITPLCHKTAPIVIKLNRCFIASSMGNSSSAPTDGDGNSIFYMQLISAISS
jgi:hypothetical protein